MSPTRTLTSMLLSAAIAAGSMAPLASAASARDWNGSSKNGHSQAQHQNYGGNLSSGRNRDFSNSSHQFDRDDWNGGRRFRGSDRGWQDAHDDFRPRHHREHRGRNIALGAAAAILGLAIAAEASRGYDHGYRD